VSLAWSPEVWTCAKDVTSRRNARIMGIRVGMTVLSMKFLFLFRNRWSD
jgi:hypothetical protein